MASESHTGHDHSVHAVEDHLTPTPLLIGIGCLLLYLSLEIRGVALALGVLALLVPLYLWTREDVQFWRAGHVDHGVLPGRDLGWWGMVFFLGTEVMLFASLFAAFFSARGANPGVWADAREHLAHALPLVTGNTLILIVSGAFMHYALHAIGKDNRRGFFIGLAGTLVLGATFLALQVSEYMGLIKAGITLGAGSFGSIFYTLTGTHAAHVFLGLVFIAVIAVRGMLGQFSSTRHVAVDAFTVYWHFVDVVWILLYLVVYVGVV